MPDLITTTRKWGNSLGIIIPKKLGLHLNEEVRVQIGLAKHVTKAGDIMGTGAFRKSTEQMLHETDKELWPE